MACIINLTMNFFNFFPLLNKLALLLLLALLACEATTPSPGLTPQPWPQPTYEGWQRVDATVERNVVLSARTVGLELWTFNLRPTVVRYDSRLHRLSGSLFFYVGDWRYGPAMSEQFIVSRGNLPGQIMEVRFLPNMSRWGLIRLDSSMVGPASFSGYQSFLPFPEAIALRQDGVGVIGSRRSTDDRLDLLELDLEFYARLTEAGRFDSLAYRAHPLPTEAGDSLRWLALAEPTVAYGTDQQVGAFHPSGAFSLWLEEPADTFFTHQSRWYLDMGDRLLRSEDQGQSWDATVAAIDLPSERTFASLGERLFCYHADSLFQVDPQTFETHYLANTPFENRQITAVLGLGHWLVVTTLGGIYYLPQHELDTL
jgi:hypothetical protein